MVICAKICSLWLFLLSQVDTKLFEVRRMNRNIYTCPLNSLWLLLYNKGVGAVIILYINPPSAFYAESFPRETSRWHVRSLRRVSRSWETPFASCRSSGGETRGRRDDRDRMYERMLMNWYSQLEAVHHSCPACQTWKATCGLICCLTDVLRGIWISGGDCTMRTTFLIALICDHSDQILFFNHGIKV